MIVANLGRLLKEGTQGTLTVSVPLHLWLVAVQRRVDDHRAPQTHGLALPPEGHAEFIDNVSLEGDAVLGHWAVCRELMHQAAGFRALPGAEEKQQKHEERVDEMKRVGGRHETVRWERDRKCDRFRRRVQGHMKKGRTPEEGVGMGKWKTELWLSNGECYGNDNRLLACEENRVKRQFGDARQVFQPLRSNTEHAFLMLALCWRDSRVS